MSSNYPFYQCSEPVDQLWNNQNTSIQQTRDEIPIFTGYTTVNEQVSQNSGSNTNSNEFRRFHQEIKLEKSPRFFESPSSDEPLIFDRLPNLGVKSSDLEKSHNNSNLENMPFNEYHQFGEKQYVRIPSESYLELLPLINTVHTGNYYELLVETLRRCSHQISLDDFYNLVFNNHSPGFQFPTPINGKKVDNSKPSPFENEGLRLCFYILETFRHPFIPVGNFATGLVNNPSFSRIKFHEVQRVFLAAKIMFDSVIEIKGPSEIGCSISRHSIKEGYQLICEKLASSYPSASEFTFPQNHLAVGSSQLGKITKIVYPNLITRRFGRRGASRYYYMGIIWNKMIVDDELNLVIENQIIHQENGSNKKQEPIQNPTTSELKNKTKEKEEESLNSSGSLFCRRSIYSFVDGFNRYPSMNCFPRSSEFFSGKFPSQSKWAKDHMLNSVSALKKWNVDVDDLITNFNDLILSADKQKGIFSSFARAMIQLSLQSSPEEAYLHLYSVVLLLVFPVCLASEEEIPKEDKVRLHENLHFLITRLHIDFQCLSVGNANYFFNFTNIIKKMTHLIQLTSSSVETCLVEDITKEFIFDITRPATIPQNSLGITTEIDELIFESLFMAIKAVYSESIGKGFQTNLADAQEVITEIAKDFEKENKFVITSIRQIPKNISGKDWENEGYNLPFQLFKIQLLMVHDFWLSKQLITDLPMPVVNYIILNMHKDLQNLSFRNFGRRKQNVSKETFKLWWVCSSIIGEYLSILSEVVALSNRLSGE